MAVETPIDDNDDTGTRLEPECFAVVWHPKKGWFLAMPQEKNAPEHIPVEAMALTNCFIKLEREPEFLEEMAQEFMSHKRS